MEELGVADLIAMVRALQSQMNSMREMYEARIAELEAENAALKTRVADLEARNCGPTRRTPRIHRPRTDPDSPRPGRCANPRNANPEGRTATADRPWPRYRTRTW